MNPKPIAEDVGYLGSAKLKGKVAIITGGDSGIGRAVSIDLELTQIFNLRIRKAIILSHYESC